MNILRIRFFTRAARVIGTAWLAGVVTANAATPASSTATPEATPSSAAVWQAYDLQFNYFALHTYYSCDGLETRLKTIMRELGADKEARVSATGCFGSAGVGNMLTARIHVRMPTLAADAPADSFMVNSKLVTLKSSRWGESISGDCELLEQVRDQLLPALKLQRVKDDLTCVPGVAASPNRSLQVMALLPEVSAKL